MKGEFNPSPAMVAAHLASLAPDELAVVSLQMVRAQGGGAPAIHPVVNEFRRLSEEAKSRRLSQQMLQRQMLQAPALLDLVGPEVASNLSRILP